MKWVEKHWILVVVILIAAVYLYNAYGQNLLASQSSTGASLNT